jgi:hypothetical protein
MTAMKHKTLYMKTRGKNHRGKLKKVRENKKSAKAHAITTTFDVWTTTTKIVVVGQHLKSVGNQLRASDDHILYVVVRV